MVSFRTYLSSLILVSFLILSSVRPIGSGWIESQTDLYLYPPYSEATYICTPFNSTYYVAQNRMSGYYDYGSTNGTAVINYAFSHLTLNRQCQDEVYVTGDWTLNGSITPESHTKLTLNARLTEIKASHSAIVIEGTSSVHKKYITVSGGNITFASGIAAYDGLDVSYADYVLAEDMRIIGTNGNNRDGIRISYTTQSTFRHNYVKHNDYEWYITDGTQNCRFEGNYAVQLTAQATVSLWRIACYGSTHNVSGNDFIGNWAIGAYGADCDNGFYLRSYADNAQVVRNSFMDNHAVNITGEGRGGFKLNPASYNTFTNNHMENVESGYRLEVNQPTTLTVERTSWNTIAGGQVKLYHNDGSGTNKGVIFTAEDPDAQVCHNNVEGVEVISGNGSKNDYGIYFLSDSGAGQRIDYNAVMDCHFVTCDYATGWELVPTSDANHNSLKDNDWTSCTSAARINSGTDTGTDTVWRDNVGTDGVVFRPEVSEASYIVGKYNSTHYFAQNGTYGQYEWISNNASYVIQSAINNCLGGTVLLRARAYYLDVSISLTGQGVSVNLVGEAIGQRNAYGTCLLPSATFSTGEYLIDVNATIAGATGGMISNIFLYNGYWATKNVSGILLNGQASALSQIVLRDIRCQYLYNSLYYLGWVTTTTVNTFSSSDANANFVGDSDIIMKIGTGADDPICNKLYGINISHTGNMTNAVRILDDSAYNEFVGLEIDGHSYTESPLKIRGAANRFLFLRIQDLTHAVTTTKGTLYLNGSSCLGNWISGFIPYYNSMHIKIDGGAYRNTLEIMPFGSSQTTFYVNSTGAGKENKIKILQPYLVDTSTLAISHTGGNCTFEGYGITNSGSTASCVNGTWISHGLAGTPTLIIPTIKSVTVNPFILCRWAESNSTKFRVYLYWSNGTIVDASHSPQTVYWSGEYQP